MYDPDTIVAVVLGILLLIIVWSKISDESQSIRTFGDFIVWAGQICGWAAGLGAVFMIAHYSIKYWNFIQTP